MKKIFALLLAVSTFLFFSCEDNFEVETNFENYAVFYQNMKSWKEPENYEFTYNYNFSDSISLAPITVKISNGTAEVDYGTNATTDSEGNVSLSKTAENFIFKSISEIYEYFEKCYEYQLATNSEYSINYTVQYESAGNYGNYPTNLIESISYEDDEDVDEFIGNYIIISSFKIND